MGEWPVVSARRFESYVRWSTYAVVSTPISTLLGGLASAQPLTTENVAVVSAVAVATLALVCCDIAVSRWSFNTLEGRGKRLPIALLVTWLLLLAAVLAGTVVLPIPAMRVAAAAAIASAAASIVPILNARRTLLLNVAILLLAMPLVAVLQIALLVVCMTLVSAVLWICWSSVWMLSVLRELQDAHEDRAALSLAEERLRISRDLHDVFGRTLTAIAVKSELASELIRRGRDDRAAAELREVRRLADEAGTEVRRVVRGDLQTTWEGEVSGARALLGSAGITCTVTGEAVPTPCAEALAWVVREGITNVLRHSSATQVTLTTTIDAGEVLLTIANDGVSDSRPAQSTTDDSAPSAPNAGTGLRAMFGRIRAIGGRAETRRDGNWFLLEAAVPLPKERE
ncbi:two-component system sensor histidine kinase DesK [Streptosporangium album]|uniref:Two-component system sensor histidine kinase DesK n=2 Tax=Streptosporangium album TaxID=47479 RepID=A0A7W7RVI2_9ACTN|nr:histidine kinase [Streptosporangium album]MBB4938960.1 two-component system sensor histidine kinase DesK [Streptosporangium album]